MSDKKFKFDVVIGNPPYQEEGIGNNTKTPSIYHLFMEQSFKIGKKVELIHPARFLFNAGDTPKKWNRKMLNSDHLKVLFYESQSRNVFKDTDIKGGIAVTFYDQEKKYKPIKTFTAYEKLNSIIGKVCDSEKFEGMDTIVFSPVSFKFTEIMHKEHPTLKTKLSKGNELEVKTNVFETIPEVFYRMKVDDSQEYVRILGRYKNKRTYRYILRRYISNKTNLDSYKVMLPEANGTGALGETLATPVVGKPKDGHTQTFLTIGNFKTIDEAINAIKYIKTKFARVMLGTLKITQHNSISTWANVPLQDFTSKSDIDWTQSVHDIDQQLYKKYGLDDKEIEFIETHVKEMD